MSFKLFSWVTIFTVFLFGLIGFFVINNADKEIYESSLLASLHLLTLAIGLGGIFFRAVYFKRNLKDRDNLQNLFTADNVWGLAAFLWIITGLLRAFGGFEKGSNFYLHNPMFHLKMGLFLLVFFLEIWPMTALIKWRLGIQKGILPDLKNQKKFEMISYMETILIVLIVFTAGLMARGIPSFN